MRYRPFGNAGQAVSALTLGLSYRDIARGPEACSEIIYTALEAGINSYRLRDASPVLAEVLGEALKHVDRKLLQVSLTIGAGDGRRGSDRDFSAQGMTSCIDKALHASGLGWFDQAILDQPGTEELPQSSLNALKALRATERVRLLGVSGDGEVMDTYVSTGAFDVLVTPYHVNSPWQFKGRIRAAREQDMAVFAYGYFPESLDTIKKAEMATDEKKRGLFGFGSSSAGRSKKDPLRGVGTFAFLHRTPYWTAEEICLAYVLTDPSISSVMIHSEDLERLNQLSTVPDRDLPPGLAAQIEMARVATAKAA
jgi:aryl-alcohol dehydrogenase-like predicted oxidoreductase